MTPERSPGPAELPEVTLVVPVMTDAGETDEELAGQRDKPRLRLAFYGSTPGYAKVFETHGWDDLQPRLKRLFAAKDTAGVAAAISDEVLDTLTVTARWDDVAVALADRYRGAADRLVAYSAVGTWKSPETVERWSSVAADWRKLTAG